MQRLNPEQVEAVNHNVGPMLILAGAGSGKTTVLVSRTGRLIDEKIVYPEQICVLTFTNKAARELKKRVSEKLGKVAQKIWAGTFHSFGLEILRRYFREAQLPKGFGIIDNSDGKAIIKDLLKDHIHFAKADFDVDKILEMIQDWRQKSQKKAKNEDEYEEVVELLLPKYLKKMEVLGVVDFESLLIKPLELFKKHPEILSDYQSQFLQVMVDEFQDTNHIQMELIKKLVAKHNNICVVGDDDQSIYGWRGARIHNILNFPKTFKGCKVVRLERNYRSTPAILKVANEVIQNNQERHHKVLKAEAHEGKFGERPEVFVYENEDVEIEEVIQQIKYFLTHNYSYKDMAVLYRSNGQGGLLEAALRFHQIPYSLSGGTAFFDRKEIRDIIAYLRMASSPGEIYFRRCLQTPSRGIGEVTIKRMEIYAGISENTQKDKEGIEGSYIYSGRKMSLMKAFENWKEADLSQNMGDHIEKFFEDIEKLKFQIFSKTVSMSSGQALLHYLTDIGYRHAVFQSFKDAASAQKRWRVVETFSNVLDAFFEKGGRSEKSLKDFLDAMELRDSLEDSEENKSKDEVQLMTLHASKGLEFPVVFLMGLEEDILPHKTLGTDVSEERRLFYVGVTRAKERLIITRAKERRKYGRMKASAPSRFLLEIPEENFTIFSEGTRPLSETQRQNMMADLFKKLNRVSDKH